MSIVSSIGSSLLRATHRRLYSEVVMNSWALHFLHSRVLDINHLWVPQWSRNRNQSGLFPDSRHRSDYFGLCHLPLHSLDYRQKRDFATIVVIFIICFVIIHSTSPWTIIYRFVSNRRPCPYFIKADSLSSLWQLFAPCVPHPNRESRSANRSVSSSSF